ncbi:MAG: DUF6125 family protein [Thermoplasmata archaeon]
MASFHPRSIVGRKPDIAWLKELPKEEIINLMFLHIRNLWAVDGVYFLGIEERFGTEAATEIDAEVWERMAVIEARRLKRRMGVSGRDILSFLQALRSTSWSLDLEDKEINIEERRILFRNRRCRVQKTRISRGLDEFACKEVRYSWMKAFAKELNPSISVQCTVCPPEEHPEDLWCEWVFVLEE